MIPYATQTGTRRNLDALRGAGWRLLVSAAGMRNWTPALMAKEGFRWALDNGAWSAHQRGEPFDVPAFEAALERLGTGADWIVAPDIVAGGAASLAFSRAWIPRLEPIAPVLVAVQDGMVADDVRPLLGARVGVFLGGSTEWKLRTMRAWGVLAKSAGCYYHVARVNSARRIRMAQEAEADSIDGTSATRFAVTLPPLDAARRQSHLRFWTW